MSLYEAHSLTYLSQLGMRWMDVNTKSLNSARKMPFLFLYLVLKNLNHYHPRGNSSRGGQGSFSAHLQLNSHVGGKAERILPSYHPKREICVSS